MQIKGQGAFESFSGTTAGAQLGRGAIRSSFGATYRAMLAQGATQSRSASTYCPLRAQGATEYLVLLAVVLIVALVSVALLGFFPGMASDAQETQSKAYWQSATPIAITEWGARFYASGNGNYTHIYMRIKNTGSYSIRLSRVLINGKSTSDLCTSPGWWCPVGNGYGNFSVMYLFPGDEKVFGLSSCFPGVPSGAYGSDVGRFFIPDYQMPGAMSANCSLTPPHGSAVMNSFGFEYIQYIEGQQITKRQIGAKPVIIKCMTNA